MWIWVAMALVVVASGLFVWRVERELATIHRKFADIAALNSESFKSMELIERDAADVRRVMEQRTQGHADRLLALETENKPDKPRERTDRYAGWQDQRSRAERAAEVSAT